LVSFSKQQGDRMYGAHVQLIHEQVKKMLLFGKDNFTEIISIPDDSEISTNSEVKLVLTPIRKGAFFLYTRGQLHQQAKNIG